MKCFLLYKLPWSCLFTAVETVTKTPTHSCGTRTAAGAQWKLSQGGGAWLIIGGGAWLETCLELSSTETVDCAAAEIHWLPRKVGLSRQGNTESWGSMEGLLFKYHFWAFSLCWIVGFLSERRLGQVAANEGCNLEAQENRSESAPESVSDFV